jgi:hypothetical protein
MNLFLKTFRQRNVREQFTDAARIGSWPERVFFFGDVLSDGQGILADGAKTVG